MSQYSLTDEAIKDLAEIYAYLSEYNLELANQFLDTFEQKCEILLKFPKMGKVYEEFNNQLRGILVDNYIVFYRLVDDNIEIIRITSGYRNLPFLFEKKKSS